jgi:oxygen-independent coproporphyrinogen-3 oxidase
MSVTISPELLARFDVPGPRYTSYPTADRFVEAFGHADYVQALEERRIGSLALPLSVYVHIPFFESLCYYCACNKIVTKHHERARPYLHALAREAQLVADHLGEGAVVSQLHLGGGSPTFLSDIELRSLMDMLRHHFELVPGGEYAIEVDPRTVDAGRLEALATLGFNRLSFGVQDFDPRVQRAVHRVQPFESVQALVASARSVGFEAINLDLIYGLPMQTLPSMTQTLERVLTIRPERIALYGYAHLPERFKPQRRIHAAELPSAGEKVAMLSLALNSLQAAGYEYIGMDHFALPDDALAVARRQGRLHRNFQGYSTQPECDTIGLGVSAIGRVGSVYTQNAKTLSEYTDALDAGHLPVVRGFQLSRDDVLRRSVIMALMCQGEVSFESMELAHLVSFENYFAGELDALRPLQADGLVEVADRSIRVTTTGWFFVRAIAMVFDAYLKRDMDRRRFSKVL